MAAETLNDVIVGIKSVVAQSTTVTNTSSEYGLWRSYVNRSQQEWAETYDWPSLYREYNTRTSNSSGNCSIGMPSDYRKVQGYPRIIEDGSTDYEYTVIDPTKRQQYGSGERYAYVLTNLTGKTLVVKPLTSNSQLVSGASIFIPYFKSVASLVSPNDPIECPNPDFLVKRSIALIWEAREDARFEGMKIEADKIMARLLETELTPGEGHDNKVQTTEEAKFAFRIGRR